MLHAPRCRARVRDRGEEERLHSIFTAQITHVCVLLYHYCHLKLYARIIFYIYVCICSNVDVIYKYAGFINMSCFCVIMSYKIKEFK